MLPTLAPCAAALSPLTADVTGDVGGGEANLELPDLSGVVVGLGPVSYTHLTLPTTPYV